MMSIFKMKADLGEMLQIICMRIQVQLSCWWINAAVSHQLVNPHRFKAIYYFFWWSDNNHHHHHQNSNYFYPFHNLIMTISKRIQGGGFSIACLMLKNTPQKKTHQKNCRSKAILCSFADFVLEIITIKTVSVPLVIWWWNSSSEFELLLMIAW